MAILWRCQCVSRPDLVLVSGGRAVSSDEMLFIISILFPSDCDAALIYFRQVIMLENGDGALMFARQVEGRKIKRKRCESLLQLLNRELNGPVPWRPT